MEKINTNSLTKHASEMASSYRDRSGIISIEMAQFLDMSSSIYLILNPQFQVVFANCAFYQSKWNTEAEIIGQNINNVLFRNQINLTPAQIQKINHSLERVINTRSADHLDNLKYKFLAMNSDFKNLETTYWKHSSTPLLDSSGEVQWIVHQIEDRTELHQAKEAASQANKAKNSFLAHMSHEIKTPLAAIVGFSSFLLESEESVSEQRNWVLAIKRNGEHLSHIVKEILDLSVLTSGNFEIDPIEFTLREVLEYVEALMSLKARAKGIELNMTTAKGIPKYIITDPMRLRQILISVIGNAVKFTQEGKVDVRVQMIESLNHPQQNVLQFLIEDTGIGITQDQRRNLFKPFVQGDSSTSRSFGGTGLGLTLSRKLAAALGGEVKLIKSLEDHGSTFEVRIPVAIPRKKSKALPNVKIIRDAPEEQMFKNLRILLVDDSPDNQWIVQTMLFSTGVIIDTAQDGIEALDRASTCDYDLILMDIQMPRMDGHQAAKKLRENGFSRPIIALTAHYLKSDREMALVSGCNYLVTKPINKTELINVISDFSKQVPRELYGK